MMATTATSARPEIEARGTMATDCAPRPGPAAFVPRFHQRPSLVTGLLIDVQPSLMQHQPPRLVLVLSVMSWVAMMTAVPDLFELDEQPQQPPAQRPDRRCRSARLPAIIAAAKSPRARSPRAVFATRPDRRQRIHPLAEARPIFNRSITSRR